MSDKRRITPADLRSKAWFDNPHNPGMTALYLERYLNYGLTPEELRSGKPLIGIAQTGSDLSPCNRHHLELAKRVREGITAAGGVAFEFPCHPIQETGKRPTASLDRNLAYLSLVEVLYGYPLDGEHPGDLAQCRPDAQRLLQQGADRLGHHRMEGPGAPRGR
jgi:dihydroxy-acid dehydratase